MPKTMKKKGVDWLSRAQLTTRSSTSEHQDMGIDRYVDELVDLAQSGLPLHEAVERFERIFDAYIIEAPGSFVEKRRALLEAFQAKVPQTDLSRPIADKLGALP